MPEKHNNWMFFRDVAAALGGVACILQWLGITPEDLRLVSPLPHVAWLLAAFLLFGISLWSSGNAWLWSRDTRPTESPPPWEGYESEQRRRESIAEQNRLVDLGRSVDGLLQPLQIDALRYTKDLDAFLENELNTFPNHGDLSRYSQKEVDAFLEQKNIWLRKVESAYELRFAPREKDLVLRFGKKGISIRYVASKPGYLMIHERLSDTIAAIVSAVHELDGITVALRCK